MKENETTSKKNVKFEMGDNKVKEFYKNEKILNKKPAEEKKQNNKVKKGKKVGAKDEAKVPTPVQDENKAVNEPPKVEDKKASKAPVAASTSQSISIKTTKDIEALSRNESVIKARDEFVKSSVPTNYYTFERDLRSLKGETSKLLTYFSNITCENYKNIFKNDLEPDMLLSILSTFTAQGDSYFSDNETYLVGVAEALCSV